MADIYEQIWALPESHVPVSRRGEDGEFLNPEADVLVDEQGKGDGCTSADAQPLPLLAHVSEEVLAKPQVQAFVALLDNYTAREHAPERDLTDPLLAAEVDAFLDAIFDTPAMRLATDYAGSELNPVLSADEFRSRIRTAWFEPYTNNFGNPDPFAVGFEHVFVGEDESDPNNPPGCHDSVGGYHSWIKYYLDQRAGKAAYLGHDYRDNVAADALLEPNVATVLMTWHPTLAEGGNGHELLKKPGGFFVGTMPECEFAIGSIGLLELLQEDAAGNRQVWPDDAHRVRFGDSFYDLILHPEAISRTQRGSHLRTLYPIFRGNALAGPIEEPDTPQLPTQPHNDGPIKIMSALPNPIGDDALGGEFVEIRNMTGETIDLEGWSLADRSFRKLGLSGVLAAGETRIINLVRTDQSSMQLRNSGGWILLFEADQRRAAVEYPGTGQGEQVNFP